MSEIVTDVLQRAIDSRAERLRGKKEILAGYILQMERIKDEIMQLDNEMNELDTAIQRHQDID